MNNTGVRASVHFALSLYGLTFLIYVKELNVSFYLTSGNGHNTEIFRFYVPRQRLLHQVIFSFLKASQATCSVVGTPLSLATKAAGPGELLFTRGKYPRMVAFWSV